MSKKVALLISLLLVLAISISSCNIIVKDPEVDKSTVIVEVAGKEITKQEVQEAIESQLLMESYYYQMLYGQNLDTKNSEVREQITDVTIDNLISSAVIDAKLAESAFATLSEEERKIIEEEVSSEYQKNLDSVKENYFSDTTLTGEELDAAILAKALELGYQNKEDMLDSRIKNKTHENFRTELTKDVTITEEEVKADYDSKVEAAKTKYENSPSAYNTDFLNGTTIYYRPAGFRNIKQILVKLAEDDSTQITTLKNDIAAKSAELSSLESQVETLNPENEEDNLTKADLEAKIANLKLELESLNLSLLQKEEASYEKLNAKLEEIKAKLEEGIDFDALIEEYNEDPGMMRSPAKEEGYPVSASLSNYDEAFVNASMALEKIGDISEPAKGVYGYYIVKYVSDVVEGPVAYETVKDSLQEALLKTKQDTFYNELIETWVSEANAKIYKDKLK